MGWTGQKIVTITAVPGGTFDATSTIRLTADAGASSPPPLRKGGDSGKPANRRYFFLISLLSQDFCYRLEFRLVYRREFDTVGVIFVHIHFFVGDWERRLSFIYHVIVFSDTGYHTFEHTVLRNLD